MWLTPTLNRPFRSDSGVNQMFRSDRDVNQMFKSDSYVNQMFRSDSDVNQMFRSDSDVNQMFRSDSDVNQMFRSDSDVNQMFRSDSDVNQMFTQRYDQILISTLYVFLHYVISKSFTIVWQRPLVGDCTQRSRAGSNPAMRVTSLQFFFSPVKSRGSSQTRKCFLSHFFAHSQLLIIFSFCSAM